MRQGFLIKKWRPCFLKWSSISAWGAGDSGHPERVREFKIQPLKNIRLEIIVGVVSENPDGPIYFFSVLTGSFNRREFGIVTTPSFVFKTTFKGYIFCMIPEY